MIFSEPLLRGHLIKRYKRFLADIELEDGRLITAHCPNSGAMQGLTDPGTPVWVSKSSNPLRKLPYTWQMAEVDGIFVGMNTANPNHLVEDAIHSGVISELQGYQTLRREVPYGKNSRIDILLEYPYQTFTDTQRISRIRVGDRAASPMSVVSYVTESESQESTLPKLESRRVYVEVKNVHLKRGKNAAFPSSVTVRGAKHMGELSQMVQQGHRAYVVYVVQRNDCETFEIADDIDPTYGRETIKALENGVEALVYACEVSPKAIRISHRLSFILK